MDIFIGCHESLEVAEDYTEVEVHYRSTQPHMALSILFLNADHSLTKTKLQQAYINIKY